MSPKFAGASAALVAAARRDFVPPSSQTHRVELWERVRSYKRAWNEGLLTSVFDIPEEIREVVLRQ